MTKTIFIANATFAAVILLGTTTAMAQNSNSNRLELGVENITEFQMCHDGDGNIIDLLRLNMDVKLKQGITLEMATLSTGMAKEERICNDIQTFSNIEAGNIPLAISKFGINWEQDDKNTWFFGIRNMNEDYFTSEVTSFFTNSSCGIYPTIAANSDIANYPNASVGIHYRHETEKLTLQASLYNGLGHKGFLGHDNIYRVCPKDDGLFALGEAAYRYKGTSLFLGTSLHCDQSLTATPWAYIESEVLPALSLIGGYSHAFGKELPCRNFVGLGAHYRLRKVELGVFADYTAFYETPIETSPQIITEECATEVSCKWTLSEHFYLQPTTHVIYTAGDWHTVYSLRLGVEF